MRLPPPVVQASARSRVARSLVSWWEIPPSSSLLRGDVVRFAHSIATLARQLLTGVNSLNPDPPTWAGPWSIAPPGFARRLTEMTSVADAERSAKLAGELLDETLQIMARHGIEEATRRFHRLRAGPPTLVSFGQAEALARAVFDRARPLSVHAVVIADSFARGFADESSDLDIRLVVQSVPTLSDRRTLVEPFAEEGTIRQYGDEAYITSDQFLVGGRKIDVRYHPLAWLERAIREPFTLGGPIDLLEVTEVYALVADPDGVFTRLTALTGQRVARAREVAATSLAALRDMGSELSPATTSLEAMTTLLGPGLEYLVRAWAGLNGRIHIFPKWMHRVAPEFRLAPPEAWTRLVRIVTEPWTEATLPGHIEEWRQFVDDLGRLARRG